MMKSLERRYLLDNAEEICRLLFRSLPSGSLRETKQIIGEYVSELTQQAVAKWLNVNYSYLSRLIEFYGHALGMPHRGGQGQTVERRSQGLRDRVCRRGFKDSVHFSMLFKKMVGCTPSEYKRQTGGKWEHDRIIGSLNHGFASVIGVILMQCLLGIQTIDEAERIIVFDFSTHDIAAEGTVGTQSGEIWVKREVRQGKQTIFYRVPPGYRCLIANTQEEIEQLGEMINA